MPKPQAFFKLRVKFGDREFDAEGPSELVTQRFEEFRRLLENADRPNREQKRAWIDTEDRMTADVGKSLQEPADHWQPSANLIRNDLQTGLISLQVLPQGKKWEADATLLVLLAYKRVRSQEEVPVTRLIAALKQSGCPVTRLDRALNIYIKEHLVLKSGHGKGGTYRLTNQGLKKAEELAQEFGGMTPHLSTVN